MNSQPLYEEQDWRGKTLLICPLCKADTFERVVMLKHLVDAHNSELALVQLVDLETSIPAANPLPAVETPEEGGRDVFEVELVEIDPTIDDAHEGERKTFTIKEQ